MYMLYYSSDQSLAKDVSVFSRVKSVPFPRCVRGSAVSVPSSGQVKAASGPSCGRITAVFCPSCGRVKAVYCLCCPWIFCTWNNYIFTCYITPVTSLRPKLGQGKSCFLSKPQKKRIRPIVATVKVISDVKTCTDCPWWWLLIALPFSCCAFCMKPLNTLKTWLKVFQAFWSAITILSCVLM